MSDSKKPGANSFVLDFATTGTRLLSITETALRACIEKGTVGTLQSSRWFHRTKMDDAISTGELSDCSAKLESANFRMSAYYRTLFFHQTGFLFDVLREETH